MSEPGPRSETASGPVKTDRASSSRIAIRPAIQITDDQIARLVQETYCAIRTVQRWAAGLATHRTTNLRLERACSKLGIVRKPREAKRRIIGERAA